MQVKHVVFLEKAKMYQERKVNSKMGSPKSILTRRARLEARRKKSYRNLFVEGTRARKLERVKESS